MGSVFVWGEKFRKKQEKVCPVSDKKITPEN